MKGICPEPKKFKFELDRPIDSEARAAAKAEDDESPSLVSVKEESKVMISTTLSTKEEAPTGKTLTPTEEKPGSKQMGIIDLDIYGRYFPMLIDYSFSWIQSKFANCQKWFKNKELRTNHIVKRHSD